MKRLTATVHGRVQGVFFRQSTVQQARALQLKGWVRNEWDGTVQVVAEGAEEALQQLLQFLHEGPPAARVDRVAADWSDSTGEFTGFMTRYG